MNTIAINFSEFIQIKDNTVITTSEFVAQAFGKLHKNVLSKIDELLTQVPDFFGKLNFKPSEKEYKNNLGFMVKNRVYELTKDGFVLLAMGFTGKKAMQFKIAYIEAFNAMAQKLLSGSQSNQKTPSTIEEREPLRKAISHLVVKHGLNFSDAYRLIHQRFNIENISELPRESLNDAIHYVHSLTVDKTLYGEVLDRLALPEPKKGVYIDEEEYHYLQMLTKHAPYLIAYFKRTASAVSELNRDITYKMGVHIHNSIVATYELEKFNRIPITWQDAYREFF